MKPETPWQFGNVVTLLYLKAILYMDVPWNIRRGNVPQNELLAAQSSGPGLKLWTVSYPQPDNC